MEVRSPLMVVAPRPLLTPGCVRNRLLTWRSSTGRLATCCWVTVVEFSMLAVCTVCESAVTSTLCSTAFDFELDGAEHGFARRIHHHPAVGELGKAR